MRLGEEVGQSKRSVEDTWKEGSMAHLIALTCSFYPPSFIPRHTKVNGRFGFRRRTDK